MIFHVPRRVEKGKASGFHVRVSNMLQAFIDNGYTVDFISGNAKERKQSIKQIRRNIKEGVLYDFLYAENATIPTLLTELHHLPTHPFLDFTFFGSDKEIRRC